MPPRRRTAARGFSLIELMIAMAILAMGLLAMWNLHMVGITSTAAGRRHTVATAVARELAAGLERLPYGDARLAENVVGAVVPAGGAFGSLVTSAGTVRSGAHEWSDADDERVPGVRLTSEMREQGEGAGYQRRWTVWSMVSPRAPAGAAAGAKLIAVSVVWRDPPFARPREVVLYTQVQDPAAIMNALSITGGAGAGAGGNP